MVLLCIQCNGGVSNALKVPLVFTECYRANETQEDIRDRVNMSFQMECVFVCAGAGVCGGPRKECVCALALMASVGRRASMEERRTSGGDFN